MGYSDGMEHEGEKKKQLNEDFVEFMSRRSETDAPRYTARLKTYVDFKRKFARASAARQNYENAQQQVKAAIATKRKIEDEAKDKTAENTDRQVGEKERFSRRDEDKNGFRRSLSRSRSDEPSDACCPRKRKPCPRPRRRRRSCRPRRRRCPRRRRRSCKRRRRRRSCPRRRRRSKCRRRRRRSCGRRRRARRRCRC